MTAACWRGEPCLPAHLCGAAWGPATHGLLIGCLEKLERLQRQPSNSCLLPPVRSSSLVDMLMFCLREQSAE